MILYCFAVRDSAIQAFNRPFFAPAAGAAIRSYMDETKRIAQPGQEPNPLNAHPDDFELWQLFALDDNTGLVDQAEPKLLLRGKDVA